MCGIALLHGNGSRRGVRTMMRQIRHRGPNGSGLIDVGNTRLGHVRLSILDLSGGGQPMTNERGDLAVTFNGEIYNHLELRRKIESRHVFRTRSDTEVLLHLYEDMGEDMLKLLDGMFAFALAGTNQVLMARDPIGIKPLYYGTKGGMLAAASELKAFPPMDTLAMLPAGHAIASGSPPWRFAQPFPPANSLLTPPIEEAMQEIRRRLDNAVVKRLMSDVPVGVYLSGGLDSSLIAALMRPHTTKLHSFTAGMVGAPDLEAARRVAAWLGTEHHELIYTRDDVVSSLPEVILHLESFDAPLVRSAVPMYFVSKLAADHVRVVLSGEGADEIFAGYEYLSNFDGGARLKRELTDIVIRLQDTNLQRADRMSMAHGLEARVPFLDIDLVRYVSRLPIEWLAPRTDRPEKWLLRASCAGLLPPTSLSRKKMKFSEGAGSASVVADLARARIAEGEFIRNREVGTGIILRSAEELYYYRIWREVMPRHINADCVGRTIDPSAAADPCRPIRVVKQGTTDAL
jgi:asparagine synthase (glutamine-hydrolysing)